MNYSKQGLRNNYRHVCRDLTHLLLLPLLLLLLVLVCAG